jgi:hypothetical protein
MAERIAQTTVESAARQAARVPPQTVQAAAFRRAPTPRIGNQAMGRLLAPVIQRRCAACEEEQKAAQVQTKLTVGPVGDAYEQEADRIANIVTRPEANGSRPAASLGISRYVQRNPAGEVDGEATEVDPSVETELQRGGGRPLPVAVRAGMEERFGIRFGSVRIHIGGTAERLAAKLDALAFTHGRNIYFGAGAYAPGTPEGDRLLAHELTHVVQQTGGAPAAPGPAPVQRVPLIRGTEFHRITARILTENREHGLVSEAPIPGANRNTTGLERLGRADLYQSSDKNTIIGVRGKYEKQKGVNVGDDPNAKLRYETAPIGAARIAGGGEPARRPRPRRGSKKFDGEFPEWVKVADLKAIWRIGGRCIVEKPGEGIVQVATYGAGLQEFVNTAAKLGRVAPGSTISTGILTGVNIPRALDYRHFDAETARPSDGAVIIEGSAGPERYWMYEVPNTGLIYYFNLVQHPAPETRALFEETFRRLQPVRQDLLTSDTGVDGTINLPVPRKRRPGAPLRRKDEGAGPKRADGIGARGAVQRRKSPRSKKDWTKLGEKWETDRRNWDKNYAAKLLQSRGGTALDNRLQVNAILGLAESPTQGWMAGAGKRFESIKLWSGRTGQLLGALRFKLGGTFDKVAAAFNAVKERIGKFWDKLIGQPDPGVSGGWEKRLVAVLFKAIKFGLRQFVSVFFELCANCLEGLIAKVVHRFTEDISEKLHEEIEKLRTQFDEFEQKFKAEFESRFGSWDKFLEDLAQVQQWLDILTTMERLIRLGVQAVACLSPPALGCLWGLVVQGGLDIALNLVMGTDWFQQNVINHSFVRDIIKRFAGPSIRQLLAATLEKMGLGDFAKDVAPCTRVENMEPPPVPPVDPIPPGRLRAHRDAWERANHAQFVRDLQDRMVANGKPPTERDLQTAVKALAQTRKSGKELAKVFQSMPRTAGGQLDLGVVVSTLARSDTGTGGGRRSPLAASDPVALRKDLESSDWKSVPLGGMRIDYSHTIPRLLVRTRRDARFAALVSVKQAVEKGRKSYTITDASGIMLLTNVGTDLASAEVYVTTETQGKQKERSFTFIPISGSAGDYIDESGEMFRGLVLSEQPAER